MDTTLTNRIVAFFGSSLVPVSSASLDHFALPEDVKRFLKSYGLPLEPGLLIHFYADASELEDCIDGQTHFLIIGDDYGTRLGIKEQTGEVLSLSYRTPRPIRFINSSLLAMLVFLQIYKENQPALVQASDEEAAEIVDRMREDFQALDARAVDSPDNWWSTILEQIRDGLL